MIFPEIKHLNLVNKFSRNQMNKFVIFLTVVFFTLTGSHYFFEVESNGRNKYDLTVPSTER